MSKIDLHSDQQENSSSSNDATPWAWIKCVRDICDPTKNPPSNVEAKELPVQLLPWLFLGDRQSARRLARRGNKVVTHILSLHAVAPYEEADMQERLQGSGIVHMRINCEDTEGYDMIGIHWDACHDFLANVRKEHYEYVDKRKSDPNETCIPRVLVHCVAGINRSGLIACAAHMVLEEQPLLQVVQSCVQKRGSVLWNQSFQRQLVQLARSKNLLGPMPNGYDNTKLNESFDNSSPPPPPAHNVVITKQEKQFRLSLLLQSRSRIVQKKHDSTEDR